MVSLSQYQNEIQNAKESSGFSSVPSGEYVVVCTASEEKANRKGNGHYIQNNYEIQGGEYAGETLIDRINHDNPNETARNIAFATLKALGNAIGKPLTNTEELIGKRIIAVVKNQPSDRPIEDDNGNQKIDDNGNPMFWPNINISKYKPYKVETTNAPTVATGRS